MKYELETIPVWDSYKQESECPLCLLENKAEQSYVRFFLGNSVMVPEIRVQVNQSGFCPPHLQMLHKGGNALGLSLMLHTHLERFNSDFTQTIKKLSGKKTATLKSGLVQLAMSIGRGQADCLICMRISETLKRYSFTILYLLNKDEDFVKTFYASRGFCLNHFKHILDMAQEIYSGKKLASFIQELLPLQQKNLARLAEELYWYTQKFDYTNQDKPWGTAKDALPRVLQKLSGKLF